MKKKLVICHWCFSCGCAVPTTVFLFVRIVSLAGLNFLTIILISADATGFPCTESSSESMHLQLFNVSLSNVKIDTLTNCFVVLVTVTIKIYLIL